MGRRETEFFPHSSDGMVLSTIADQRDISVGMIAKQNGDVRLVGGSTVERTSGVGLL